jgi:Cd2+/Zn2+-exporting ATPase
MKVDEKTSIHQHHDDCCSGETHTHTKNNGHEHSHDHDHDHGDHSHGSGGDSGILKSRWMLWLSLAILAVFLVLTYILKVKIPRPVEIGMMLVAYVLAGNKTVALAFRKASRGDFFNEFTLMTIATFGAFYIGEFSEGVAVMIFYEIGELFQDIAVNRSKRSIKALLDIRPDTVTVLRDDKTLQVRPDDVRIGETILSQGCSIPQH